MWKVELFLCLVLSIIGSSVADPEAVYGTKGSSIFFICPYRKETHNVIWNLVYNSTTSVQISDGDFIADSLMETRVSIVGDHSAGEYNLQLRQLQESDKVVYRCSTVHGQEYKEKDFKLELLAAPSSLTLQDLIIDNKILGTEGQKLTLKCTATGGYPPPLVTVTVDNVAIHDNQFVTYTIPTLQRRHDKLMVQCNASSHALTSPLVSTAALYLHLKPQQPFFSTDPVSAEETKPLVVSCTSTGSRPAARFQWTLGLLNITSYSTTQITNTPEYIYTVTSTLTYIVDRTYNGQTVTCEAGNTVATVKTSKTLDVKFAPNIAVTNVTYIQNNSNRTVTCVPVGNPTTYSYYKWQHKSKYGKLIRELDGGQNGVLTLQGVSEIDRYQDSGEYVCKAANGVAGRDGKKQQTGSGYVTVNAQPVLISGYKDAEYGEPGKDVCLHVYVYSVPKYILVKWYKSNTPISTTDKYILSDRAAVVSDIFHGTIVQLDGYEVTLTIKNLVESDFNVSYRVELCNGVGQTVVHTMSLLYASAPQAPRNFTVLIYSEFSIVVQWEAGYNGGHEQTFYVQYRGFGSIIWIVLKLLNSKQTGTQTYTLIGLQDGSFYELRMYAENRFNKSLPTQTEIVRTLRDCKLSWTEAVNKWVAGGLSAVIVIMLIIIIVLVLREQKIVINRPIPHTLSVKHHADSKELNEQDHELNERKKHGSKSTQEYETLGTKDNPDTYTVLRTQQDQQISKSVQVYETLGMADNPNIYSELQGTQDQTHHKTTVDNYQPLCDHQKLTVYENMKTRTKV